MLILASQSPRRSELLRNAGIAFQAQAADIDESVLPGEGPQGYVERLARGKALAVLASAAPGAVVLGADTTVVVESEIMAKPENVADAHRMLAKLAGRWHDVLTGVCVAWRNAQGQPVALVATEVTQVEFSAMTVAEIVDYVASGEPMDKAGAYGIQGRASRWIPRIHGCYYNVMGLPVARVCQLLAEAAGRGASVV